MNEHLVFTHRWFRIRGITALSISLCQHGSVAY